MQRYLKFSDYLKERFGERVHRVSVDAGFSCPNRDGRISDRGCIYCNNQAFSFQSRTDDKIPLDVQVKEGIDAARRRFKAQKFMVYFQAYTNTYAPKEVLKERYDVVRRFDDLVAISIATRPDCMGQQILELIDSYADDYEVWLEYGVQSVHDQTLDLINRGHRYEEFLRVFQQTRGYRIKVSAHVIIGLPGETKEMMLRTADEMSRLRIDAIKIHPLHIVKKTEMEELFTRGMYKPLELDAYVELLVSFLERLRPDIAIQRLSAYCPASLLIAPGWVSQRNKVENMIEQALEKRDTFQGRSCRHAI